MIDPNAVTKSESSFKGPTTLAAQRWPDQIGPYQVVELLGQGGMGQVLLGQSQMPKRQAAIKLMLGEGFSADLLMRFRREMEVLARLEHPGIARLFESGVVQIDGHEQPWYAMEFVEGLPLDAYVKRNNLDTRTVVALVIKIAQALHFAHQKGVIHRDIKPANILVDQSGAPKILDFGIARIAETGEDAVAELGAKTRFGQVIGTLAYMSPEQLSSSANADVRADVYALGVVLYELLTGELPLTISTTSLLEAIKVLSEGKRKPLSAHYRNLRGEIELIVDTASHRELTQRYDSAASFAADLENYLANRPLRARRASLGYVFGKFLRRNPLLVTAFGLALVSLVGATLWALQAAQQARLAQQQAEQRVAGIRDVIGDIALEQADLLQNMPEGKMVRAKTLEIAIAKLDSLQAEFPSDDALRVDRAALLARLALVQYFPNALSLDLPEAASKSRARADAIYREISAATRARDPNIFVGQSRVWKQEANALRALGKPEQALPLQIRALALIRDANERFPKSEIVLNELSGQYTNLGQLHSSAGSDLADPQQAIRYLTLALATDEILLSMKVGEERIVTIHNIGAAHGAIALAHNNQGDLANAINAFQASIAREDEALALAPTHIHILQQVIAARSNYLNVLIDAGRSAEGVAEVPILEATSERIIALEPNVAEHLLTQARVLVPAAHILWLNGAPDRASTLLAKAELAFSAALIKHESPDLRRRRSRVRWLLANLAEPSVARRLLQDALQDAEFALAGGLADHNTYLQLARSAWSSAALAETPKAKRHELVSRGLVWMQLAKAHQARALLPTQMVIEEGLIALQAQ
jgi:hypothetical protein